MRPKFSHYQIRIWAMRLKKSRVSRPQQKIRSTSRAGPLRGVWEIFPHNYAFGFFQKSRTSFPHVLDSQGVLTWRLSSMLSFPHWSLVLRLGCLTDFREPPASWSPCHWQPCSYCLWLTANIRTRRKPLHLPRVFSSPSLSSCCFSSRLCLPFDAACHSGYRMFSRVSG
jgi:hypothetical protein